MLVEPLAINVHRDRKIKMHRFMALNMPAACKRTAQPVVYLWLTNFAL